MPTTIYLIRHGDVENPDNVLYGRLPGFRLSVRGWCEAETTARWLTAQAKLERIYTSPMLRARMTADIIAWAQEPPTPVVPTVLLNEIRSAWQGHSNTELELIRFNFYAPKRDEDDESISDIAVRVRKLVRRILKQHPNQHIACVSHGDPIMIAYRYYAGHPISFGAIRGDDYPKKAGVISLRFSDPTALPEIAVFDPNGETVTPPGELVRQKRDNHLVRGGCGPAS